VFNEMTGGFRKNEFSILCGSTGSGKTTFCANLSADLIEQGVPHFVASVETGATDFINRVLSVFAEQDLNHGDPIPKDRLQAIHSRFGKNFENSSLELSLYDNRIPHTELIATLAWQAKYNGCKVAILDNLNFFLDVTRSSEALIEMDRVIHDLIIFCKQVPMHVIMIMHPRKTDEGRIESENDIKGSSTANPEAHNIFLWNRPHPDAIERGIAEPHDRELLIAKMRRRGKYVRQRLLFRTMDGTSYQEGGRYALSNASSKKTR
jgi:archaellum biogenesis ATPase FlaH